MQAKRMAKKSDDAMKGLAVPIDSVKTDRLKVTTTEAKALTAATATTTTEMTTTIAIRRNKTTVNETIMYSANDSNADSYNSANDNNNHQQR